MDELDLEIRRGDQNFDDAEKWKRRAESAEKQLAEARASAADAQMLAHQWMKRHDGVLAGKTDLPYPEPADLPKALAEALRTKEGWRLLCEAAERRESEANKARSILNVDGARLERELAEIHNRFCGENGELCQVCKLKAEREEKK